MGVSVASSNAMAAVFVTVGVVIAHKCGDLSLVAMMT